MGKSRENWEKVGKSGEKMKSGKSGLGKVVNSGEKWLILVKSGKIGGKWGGKVMKSGEKWWGKVGKSG